MKYVHTTQEQMDRGMVRNDVAKSSASLPGSGPVNIGQNRENLGLDGTIREDSGVQPRMMN
jgi:hypothetical protein